MQDLNIVDSGRYANDSISSLFQAGREHWYVVGLLLKDERGQKGYHFLRLEFGEDVLQYSSGSSVWSAGG